MKNPINYRSLIKQVYRYTRPRNYRHSEKLWPYIGIKRDADGCFCEPRYLGKAIPVLSLDDVAAVRADDLVIVASGPSINQLDLTALLQADWMAVNGSPSVLERYPNKPLQYYAVIDPRFCARPHSHHCPSARQSAGGFFHQFILFAQNLRAHWV